jgi:exonuclease SbcC
MRPHRLRVQAFGAFAATEQVCFDDLDGLFLLHGETGAGKTTLLDAIAFALYGRVPGERGTAKRLRSDHAAAGLPTEVELEATIGGRRLRITRRPEQERPKKSGVGVTKEQASIRVDEQSASGGWENKSTRVAEADQEIRDLMGMSAEQFFQVVLLPQGQFAQFLQAKAQDKEELLRKLFSTDRFRRVEDWLAERRRVTKEETAAAAESVSRLVAQVAQAADVPVPDSAQAAQSAVAAPAAHAVPAELAAPTAHAVPAAPVAVVASPGPDEPGPGAVDDPVPWQSAWAAALAANAAAVRDEAAGLMAARKRELDAALTAQGAAVQLADRQRRRQDALRRQAELEAAAAEIGALRVEADEASRAAEVAPLLDEADRAAAAAATAARLEERARAEIPADREMLRAEAPSALRAAGQQQQARVGRLEALRSLAQQAAAEDANAAAAGARASQLDVALADAAAEAARREQARPQAVLARDAAGQAAAALPAAQAAADAARRIATDAAALVKERAARDRLHEAHLSARERALESGAAALRVREARIDGMRAELAASMTDGSPCPVCGSLDHPDPVEPTFETVSRATEDAANAVAERDTAEADRAGQKVAAADGVIGELAHRLIEAGFAALPAASCALPAGGPSALVDASALKADGPLAAALAAEPETLAAAARQADADATRLAAEATRLRAASETQTAAQRDLDALDEAIAKDQARIVELNGQRSAALAEAAAAAQRAEDRRAELRVQLGDAADLDAALRAARIQAETLAAAADAADEAFRASADLLHARERARAAVISAGFAAAIGAAAAPAATAVTVGARDAEADYAATIAAARAAFRDGRWRRDADGRITRHQADTEAVASQLADPDLDVALDPPAPVAATTEAAESAQRAHTAATAAHATAERTAAELAKLSPLLDAQLADLAPLIERADQIRQLADLANGQGANQYRMTLSSFVLAARLEEVAAAASQRLTAMTGGRYSLAHSDARRGNARAGLSLLACDSWTGANRDTATLSGGETFMASLSLALGLADVVTAEAAGTPMEALFVDEGFGTLDEDTLDEVMNVLDGLRAGGRIVGIVSHVSELRQRIPAQVRVAKDRHGSHVAVTAG